jgi:hypothetical protein
MRVLCVFALLLASCVQSLTLPTDDPYEQHILAETARFAKLLNVRVTAEVVDDVYMVTSSDGLSKVPAAGWYDGGKIKYWRIVVRERGFEYGTALAAHEVCHSQTLGHNSVLDACVRGLLNGTT